MNQIDIVNNHTVVSGLNLCVLFKLFVILSDCSSHAKCYISLTSALFWYKQEMHYWSFWSNLFKELTYGNYTLSEE